MKDYDITTNENNKIHEFVEIERFMRGIMDIVYRANPQIKKDVLKHDKHIWKTTHPYRMFKVESRFEIELQKALEREELNEAISRYTQQGGEITKLKELPAPTLPSVGSREWEWEVRVGLGFVGSEQINEPTYMDEERLEFILSR